MPRYENGNKFIDIRLRGSTVVTTSGRVGGTFKTREAWFPAPELAAARFTTDIVTAKNKDFVHASQLRSTASNPELEAQILERLDDDAARIVYGDWLLERGDPRGELAALQRQIAVARPAKAQSLRRREAELIEDHSSLLFGTLDEIVPPSHAVLVPTWRLGFIDAVAVRFPDVSRPMLPGVGAATELLVRLHSTRFLRAISFSAARKYAAALNALAPLSGTLESVAVSTFDDSRGTVGNLRRFSAAHRRLRRLALDVSCDPIEGLDLPDLEHLELGRSCFPTQLEVIARSVWPNLTSLVLAPQRWSVAPRDLDALLTRDRLPRLATLQLSTQSVEVATSICGALVRSTLIGQLAKLVVIDASPEVMAVFRARLAGSILSFAARAP